jgi:hypothetical protein
MTTKLEQLKARHAKELAKMEREIAIAELLPDNVSPTISNVTDDGSWLSFGSPAYDPEKKWSPVSILESLESAGFEQVPASLVKWDDWRRTTEPGLCDDIPDVSKSGYKLTDVEAIAPVWVVPCQHTGPDVQLYMRKLNQLFRVSVDIPRVAHLTARKIDKIHDVYNHDDSLAFRYVKKPKLTRSHCNMPEWRNHPKWGGYANSDLFTGILSRQTQHVPELIKLEQLPAGVSIDTSGFLAQVTIAVD